MAEALFLCSSDLFHNGGKNEGKDAANAGFFLFVVESAGIFAESDVFVPHPTVNIGLGLAVIIFHGSEIEHNEHSSLSFSRCDARRRLCFSVCQRWTV